MPVREYKAYTVHGFVHCFVHASSDYHAVWHAAAYADGYVQARDVGSSSWEPGVYWKRLVG